MSDDSTPPPPRRMASFPTSEVRGAVIESSRRICDLGAEQFDELPDLDKLRKLDIGMDPVRAVPCQEALPLTMRLAVTIVRWASQETEFSQEFIVETASSWFTR